MDFHWPDNQKVLRDGWTLTQSAADAYAAPSDIPATLVSLAAPVPGTVAKALQQAGRFDTAQPEPLDGFDFWYRTTLCETPGPATLQFDGLATVAEIFLNGEKIATSESMYAPLSLPVTLTGSDELAIAFRALKPRLARKGPRARWRPQMMSEQGLRLFRTTTLGYMPGWCPEVHAVGPWRPVRLIRPAASSLADVKITATLEDNGNGLLTVSFEGTPPQGLILLCEGHEASFKPSGEGRSTASLTLPTIKPWWPATHGEPSLYDVSLSLDGKTTPLARTGFRTITMDRGTDGKDFALLVNGTRIFCRGAVWTNADIVGLPGDRAAYEPWLKLAAEAGMNMIRIGGTMAYESPHFFALCDELGLLVWQDFMFANFDYPVKDEAFIGLVRAEIEAFLQATAHSPSLAILSGGSEMYQQGAMLGLPESIWKTALTTQILPALCATHRPDAAYVENSPSGGAQPFFVNEGVGHYYGVGAYCRPLDDARRASVRFASECLAFAHVPQQTTLDAHLPVAALHHPDWKARVPRDRGASWDFEDIREHYLGLLYGEDPVRLRRENPARYLDLSRAVTGEVAIETFSEWRRNGSTCNGALIWTLQDFLPGPGWGVIDATGTPKPVWHALKRALKPVSVVLTDEGVNGLSLHAINETPNGLDIRIEVSALRDGRQPVVSGARDLHIEARQTIEITCTDLFGAFFDTNYAYRFGPPSHDVVVARLVLGEETVAEAFHFPLGRSRALYHGKLSAALQHDETGWSLLLEADAFQQSVHIQVEGFSASEDWFHMPPNAVKVVPLRRHDETPDDTRPSGAVRGLSGSQTHF